MASNELTSMTRLFYLVINIHIFFMPADEVLMGRTKYFIFNLSLGSEGRKLFLLYSKSGHESSAGKQYIFLLQL